MVEELVVEPLEEELPYSLVEEERLPRVPQETVDGVLLDVPGVRALI